MTKKSFQIVAVFAAVALVGTLSLTVFATGDDPANRGDGSRGGFLRHLHQLGHSLHGAGHQQDPMAELIERLELTPDQQQRLEKIHEILGSYGSGGAGSMVELHERLVAQFEQGMIDTAEIRLVIDDHLEQVRETAYAVTDELIALVNGLDATQREVMLEHLQASDRGRQHHGG